MARVTSPEQSKRLGGGGANATLLYACTGSGNLLQACLELNKDNVIFVRHRSGPVYYWYEALSTRFLKTDAKNSASGSSAAHSPAHVDDVVVDDYGELLWRCRALFGVKNLLGTRILALGGVWGKYAPDAPQKAVERFGLKIIEVSCDVFGPQLRRARADSDLVATAERWTP